MALRIRLTRGGAKKRPFYNIVVADARSPRDGRFIEKLGFYNPMVARDHPDRIRFDADRAKHWLEVGAQPSDRVAKFFAQAELMTARPRPEQTKKPQPKAKAQERLKEAEERRKAAEEEAAAKAAEAEAPAEEAPAEAAAGEEAQG
jgi:small subunit ribosomal protein S16